MLMCPYVTYVFNTSLRGRKTLAGQAAQKQLTTALGIGRPYERLKMTKCDIF